MSHDSDSMKSILFALGANLAIAIAKLAAAIVTGSGSMMAESIHSMADSGNQLLLILGLKRSKIPPSAEYPLGHGKAIYFWSFVVALILFSLGGMFSIYEGIHKLRHPEPLTYPLVAIGVLIFSLVAEGVSLWGCLKEVNKERRSRSLIQWFRQSRKSELIVVFGEDFAAMLGLVFALVAVSVTFVTGNPVYDAVGSIVIGVLLVFIAVFIAIEVKGLLIGQSVEADLEQDMAAFLQKRDEIKALLSIITLQMGTDVMVAIKASMNHCDSAVDMVAAINACEKAFKAAYPQVKWIFFEPDVK
jgi:cation diffusion facilitator family transporter